MLLNTVNKFPYSLFLSIFLFVIFVVHLDTSFVYLSSILVFATVPLLAIKNRLPFYQKEDKIALSFFIVWVYGFVFGIIRGNELHFVFANFTGMVLYLFYFILSISNISLTRLNKVIIASGIVLACSSILSFSFKSFWNITIPVLSDWLTADFGYASTGQIRMYDSLLTIVFPLFGLSIYYLFFFDKSHQRTKKMLLVYLFYFLVSCSSIVVVTASKGFVLGAIFVFVATAGSLTLKKLWYGKVSLIFFIIVLLLLFFLWTTGTINVLTNMFAAKDVSNAVRYEQLINMFADLTFWGKGLGATIPGLVRNNELPYGFELTYINLIHKFGIFTIVLFIGWIYMFFSLAKLIYQRKSIKEAIIAISSLGYLMPSVGNPLLMHPSLVILNCITLYYIRRLKHG